LRKPTELPYDVKKARKDPAYFGNALLDHELYDFQADVVNDPHQTVVHVAARGSGKTVEAAVLAAWYLFTKPQSTVCYISAQEQQSKLVKGLIMDMVAGTPLLYEIKDEGYKKIETRAGSRLFMIPGQNPTASRGYHPKKTEKDKARDMLLIIDEAASISEEMWVASAGILAAAKKGHGKKLILGTPVSKLHWFFREYQQGLNEQDKTTSSHHTAAERVDHILQAGRLDEYQQKMQPHHFAMEYEAVFMDDVGSVFGEWVQESERDYTTPKPYSRGETGNLCLGIDLSGSTRRGTDWACLVLVEHWWGGFKMHREPIDESTVETRQIEVPEYVRIADIRHFKYLDHHALKREINDIKKRWPGLGRFIIEEYQSAQMPAIVSQRQLTVISPTNKSKRLAVEYLAQLMRDGLFQLPKSGKNV
jgi:hypothetical protein